MSKTFEYARFDDEIDDHVAGNSRFNNEDEDFEQICNKISENVTRIKGNVSAFEKLLLVVGTPREPISLRSQISSMQQQTSGLIKTVNDQLRLANDRRHSSHDRNTQFRVDRLQTDFKTLVQTFQRLQRDILDKIKTSQGNSSVGVAKVMFAGGATSLESPQQVAISDGIAFDSSRQISVQISREDELVMVQQREAELARLEQDMVAVHEIFKDLSSMVYEQGQVVETIESNVEQASEHVEQAREQLASAVQHKRSYRRNCVILWVVIAVILAIIVIIVAVQLS